MKIETKHLSQFQMALADFKHNRLAMGCFIVLVVFYSAALLAPFLAPYSFDNEDRNYSYAPPTPIHFFDEKGWRGPHVYGVALTFNEFHQRLYKPDSSKKFALQFFLKGDSYKILGILPCSRHFFGVEKEGRIYLWGADARGAIFFRAFSTGRGFPCRLV